jgi:hypothetical protein
MVAQANRDLCPSADRKRRGGGVRSDDSICVPAYDRKVFDTYARHSEDDGRRHLSTIGITIDQISSAVPMTLQAGDSIECQFGFFVKAVWFPDTIGS